MSIEELLSVRTSCRNFQGKPVEVRLLERLIERASQAPSMGNLQLYHLITVSQVERKAKLAEIHFQEELIQEAPVALTFCVDLSRNQRWHALNDSRGHDKSLWWFLMGLVDTVVYAQTLSLLAESEGLGTCYLGATLSRVLPLIDFFECPQGVVPMITLAIGYPNDPGVQQNRLNSQGFFSENAYGRVEEKKLLQLYQEKNGCFDGFRKNSRNWLQIWIQEEGVRNFAQYYSKWKYPDEDVTRFSKNLVLALRKQGILF